MTAEDIAPRPDAATRAQNEAADPACSSWVAANAGSGKTRVLTDRVSRLLLHGVQPHRILCLTYTRAAAAQMQERLFERLGEWVLLEDAKLRKALVALGESEEAITDEVLRAARRLFARALDAPGGLKIQTIHAFCGSVLRRFPLEAGVPPDFVELDENMVQILLAEVLDEMAESPEGAARIQALMRHVGGSVEKVAGNLVGLRGHFGPILKDEAFRQDPAACARSALGLASDDSPQKLVADLLGDEVLAMLHHLAWLMDAFGGPQDKTTARKLEGVLCRESGLSLLLALLGIFVYGENTQNSGSPKHDRLPAKKTRKAAGEEYTRIADDLRHWMDKLAAAQDRIRQYHAARRLEAILRFAIDFLPRFEKAKRRRGALDFNDLVLKTRDLLASSRGAVSWVMFRLDGGIDHILVDEAQDTSPEQWQIIAALANEFFAGEGREVPPSETPFAPPARSIFVVGDRKQSIYSFQGADPAVFDTMHEEFARRLAEIGRPLRETALEYSFRSAPPILEVVDAVSKLDGAAPALEAEVHHEAFHADLPGCVDLWPRIEPEKAGEAQSAVESGDPAIPAETPARRLARRIVAFVKENVGRRLIREKKDGAFRCRPMRHGDILILVRRRKTVFNEVIAALKRAGMPVAGVDRLQIAEELAVRDVLSLFRFLDLPQDDLSLAEALRSPLFGFSESDLFALAPGRRGTLWQALEEQVRRGDAPAHWQRAVEVIADLRARADFLRPHDLLQRLLAVHGGRRRILGRLGAQGAEAIDALLGMAAAFEGVETPTLGRFLLWMEGETVEIKREFEGETDEIRVMTVHGAKGLEAPVVILPDTVFEEADISRNEKFLHPSEGERPSLLPDVPRGEAPARVLAAKDDARRKQLEENWRLLYVAMTRAEQWLVVCGASSRNPTFLDWHGRVEAALATLAEEGRAKAVTFRWENEKGKGFRLAGPGWVEGKAEVAAAEAPASRAPSVSLPAWLEVPPSPAPGRPAPLNPSALGGEKVLATTAGAGQGAMEEDGGAVYGTWLHRLLEHLADAPSCERAAIAHWLFKADPASPDEEMRQGLIADALRLLDDPVLAREVFRPDALAEVDLAGRFGGGDRGMAHPFRGTIDRLIVTGEEIVAIDFKTNAEVPARPEEIPEGILRQMGAYGRALEEIWPDRPVRLRILWTRAGTLMEVPRDLAGEAFERACLDLSAPAA